MSPVKITLSGLVITTHLLSITNLVASEVNLTSARKDQLTHIVQQDCGSCHGMTLKGGLGPALLPESLQEKPLLFLQNTILYGRVGTAMPPWKTLLTEQEALWISQQLKAGKIAKSSAPKTKRKD
jgi:cytochrome c55X